MEKIMKIGYVPGYEEISVPMLRLSGKYLIKQGFDVGQAIKISIERGKIVIEAINESAQHD